MRLRRFGRTPKERLQDMMVNVAAVMVLILLVVSIRGVMSGRRVSMKAADVAAMRAPVDAVLTLRRLAAAQGLDFGDVLAVYMLDNGFFRKAAEPMSEDALITQYVGGHKKKKRALGEKTVAPYASFLRRLTLEITCFPVQDGEVMYGDSFGAARRNGSYIGIDLFDELREPGRLRVVAMARGVVTEVKQNQADGHYVLIKSDAGTLYKYAHLAYVNADIVPGAKLEAGASLGYMGDSGSDGYNELFPVRLTVSVRIESDVFKGAAWVNPYIFLRLIENGY